MAELTLGRERVAEPVPGSSPLGLWIGVTALFVIGLFVAQILTGTSLEFASLVALFISLTSATIRVVGGLYNLFGLSVAILAMQQVVVACIAKAVFLSPADEPLQHPIATMTVFCVGMFGLLVAATVYQALGISRAKPLFAPVTDARTLYTIGWILTILALARFLYLARFGVFEGAGGGVLIGGLVGPIRTITFLPALAVAFSTAAVIVGSGGKRCVGWVNGFAMLGPVFFGIYGAIRADAASAIMTFAFTLWALKFKLHLKHYVVAAVTAYFFQGILFPYALYARGEGDVRVGTFEERVGKAAGALVDVAIDPQKYEVKATEQSPLLPWDVQRLQYYEDPMPTLQRYSNIVYVDEIVDATIKRGHTGWTTTIAGFEFLIPRMFNRAKEAFGTSNWIARRGDGIVGGGDFYTQITLCFFVDAFLSFGMTGVFFVSIVIGFAFFTVYSLMFKGTLYQNVYTASLAFSATWVFSEGTIQAQMVNVIQNPIYMILIVLPIFILARTLTKPHVEGRFIFDKRTPQPEAGADPA